MRDRIIFENFGKWILAGEHSVLRGGRALVFPLRSRSVRLSFVSDSQGVQSPGSKVLSLSAPRAEMEIVLLGLIEKACELLGVERGLLSGQLRWECDIPVGAGLGASAALCVSMARWFSCMGFLKQEDMFIFSKGLEDIFHGESSGVDVAVSLSGEPLIYERNVQPKKLTTAWSPRLYLSYSGHLGMTKDCVGKVLAIWDRDPSLGVVIDAEMGEAVQICERALGQPGSDGLLARGMEMASSCFERWGLVSEDLKNHMSLLKELGALATKPTGSGGGGYVLSLWPQAFEPAAHKEFLSCF